MGSHSGGDAYTVANGATLAGVGTISGTNTVYLNAGSFLAPGASPLPRNVGTLTLPALSTSGGATFNFDLSNSTAGSNDLVQVNGPLTLNGSNTVTVNRTNGGLGQRRVSLVRLYGRAYQQQHVVGIDPRRAQSPPVLVVRLYFQPECRVPGYHRHARQSDLGRRHDQRNFGHLYEHLEPECADQHGLVRRRQPELFRLRRQCHLRRHQQQQQPSPSPARSARPRSPSPARTPIRSTARAISPA